MSLSICQPKPPHPPRLETQHHLEIQELTSQMEEAQSLPSRTLHGMQRPSQGQHKSWTSHVEGDRSGPRPKSEDVAEISEILGSKLKAPHVLEGTSMRPTPPKRTRLKFAEAQDLEEQQTEVTRRERQSATLDLSLCLNL